MEGHIKVGIRNALIILLIIVVLVPALKNGAVKAEWLPAPIRNWILAV